MHTPCVLILRLFVGALLLFVLTGRDIDSAAAEQSRLRLSAASTAAETGIIDFMVAGFREVHPEIEVSVTKAGALEVLDQARRGQADVIITHHPKSEQMFINEGYGISRTLVMYNEFVILGPHKDPLGLFREKDIRVVLKRLSKDQVPFLVPGLRSATSLALNELWSLTGIKPDWPGYEISGASTATTLKDADLFGNYTFADIGTFLAGRKELKGNITPLYRDDIALRNYYSAVIVSQKRFPQANQSQSEIFVDYLVSAAGQERLARYGEMRFGTQVYMPAAHLDEGLKARRSREELAKQTRTLFWMTGLSTGLGVLLAILAAIFLRLRRMDKILQTSEGRFRLAVAGTRDGIWDWDVVKNRAYVSPRFKEIMDPPGDTEMISDPIPVWAQRMETADREHFLALLGEYLDQGGDRQFVTEYRLTREQDEPAWIVMRGKALRDETGRAVRMAGSISDVTDRKKQEVEMKNLEYSAMHDALTGLPNRAYFLDQMQQAVSHAYHDKKSIAMLFMDLDGFKQINDNLGHQAGDAVLQQAAQRLRQTLRASDTIARLGGDEFAILLPGSNEGNALGVAHKILHAFGSPMELGERQSMIGISLGIALYPDHGLDVSSLMQCADAAMYAAKRSKKGFVVYQINIPPG